MVRGQVNLHPNFYMSGEVLERGNESFVLVDFNVVFKLCEVGVVVADLNLLLIPIRLHEPQRPFSPILLLL